MSKRKKYQMYIDGQWVDAENIKTFETLNPENNEPWAIVPEASAKDTDKAVKAAQKAFEGEWPKFCLLYTSPSPRDGLLSRMPSSA